MQSVEELVPFSFTDLHKECLSLVFRRIVDYYGARLVSLLVFGCNAFGKPRFDSDLDLLIVMRSGYWSRLSERTESSSPMSSSPAARSCKGCSKREYRWIFPRSS